MPIPGPATQINLEDTSPIFSPPGKKAEELTRESACLSLELASAAYSMNLAPWRNAGWRDFSILADSDLLTGSALNGPAASPLEELSRSVMQTLTHMRVTMRDPVTQYLGFKRQQDENASACKAVVMARPCGSYTLIGIAFKGTGKRLFDWIPNLRLSPENGYHGGFSQLTGQFMDACGRIEFPETARAMGLSRLTLSDVLIYMRMPSGPFRLWVCGHSQGAAVMQIFIDRLQKSGVTKENISGYGLASPSVTEEYRRDAGSLPIVHILNADDLVPRVGFKGHLGSCRVFLPDDRQRAELYGAQWGSPCFREILDCYRRAEDTDDALLLAYAALDLIGDQSSDTLRRVFSAADQLLFLPDLGLPEAEFTIPGLNNLARQLRGQYQTLTGNPDFPQDKLADARARFGDMIARYGLTTWFMAAMRGFTLPHRMYAEANRGETATAYRYIVTRHTDELIRVEDPSAPGGFWHTVQTGQAVRRPPKLTLGQPPRSPDARDSVPSFSAPAGQAAPASRLTLPDAPAQPGPSAQNRYRPARKPGSQDGPAVKLTLPDTTEPGGSKGKSE